MTKRRDIALLRLLGVKAGIYNAHKSGIGNDIKETLAYASLQLNSAARDISRIIKKEFMK